MAGGLLLAGVLFYTRVEKWSLLDAVYFCVVTLATVGYGDITPTTDAGRIFTIFYIVIGLGIIGGFFATLGQLIQPGGLLRKGERDLAREFHVGLEQGRGEGPEATKPEARADGDE
jgi:hypothetical protein